MGTQDFQPYDNSLTLMDFEPGNQSIIKFIKSKQIGERTTYNEQIFSMLWGYQSILFCAFRELAYLQSWSLEDIFSFCLLVNDGIFVSDAQTGVVVRKFINYLNLTSRGFPLRLTCDMISNQYLYGMSPNRDQDVCIPFYIFSDNVNDTVNIPINDLIELAMIPNKQLRLFLFREYCLVNDLKEFGYYFVTIYTSFTSMFPAISVSNLKKLMIYYLHSFDETISYYMSIPSPSNLDMHIYNGNMDWHKKKILDKKIDQGKMLKLRNTDKRKNKIKLMKGMKNDKVDFTFGGMFFLQMTHSKFYRVDSTSSGTRVLGISDLVDKFCKKNQVYSCKHAVIDDKDVLYNFKDNPSELYTNEDYDPMGKILMNNYGGYNDYADYKLYESKYDGSCLADSFAMALLGNRNVDFVLNRLKSYFLKNSEVRLESKYLIDPELLKQFKKTLEDKKIAPPLDILRIYALAFDVTIHCYTWENGLIKYKFSEHPDRKTSEIKLVLTQCNIQGKIVNHIMPLLNRTNGLQNLVEVDQVDPHSSTSSMAYLGGLKEKPKCPPNKFQYLSDDEDLPELEEEEEENTYNFDMFCAPKQKKTCYKGQKQDENQQKFDDPEKILRQNAFIDNIIACNKPVAEIKNDIIIVPGSMDVFVTQIGGFPIKEYGPIIVQNRNLTAFNSVCKKLKLNGSLFCYFFDLDKIVNEFYLYTDLLSYKDEQLKQRMAIKLKFKFLYNHDHYTQNVSNVQYRKDLLQFGFYSEVSINGHYNHDRCSKINSNNLYYSLYNAEMQTEDVSNNKYSADDKVSLPNSYDLFDLNQNVKRNIIVELKNRKWSPHMSSLSPYGVVKKWGLYDNYFDVLKELECSLPDVYTLELQNNIENYTIAFDGLETNSLLTNLKSRGQKLMESDLIPTSVIREYYIGVINQYGGPICYHRNRFGFLSATLDDVCNDVKRVSHHKLLCCIVRLFINIVITAKVSNPESLASLMVFKNFNPFFINLGTLQSKINFFLLAIKIEKQPFQSGI